MPRMRVGGRAYDRYRYWTPDTRKKSLAPEEKCDTLNGNRLPDWLVFVRPNAFVQVAVCSEIRAFNGSMQLH